MLNKFGAFLLVTLLVFFTPGCGNDHTAPPSAGDSDDTTVTGEDEASEKAIPNSGE